MATVDNGLLMNATSIAASVASDTLNMQDGGTVSLHIQSASNTHVGTFAVQLSNDNSNWVTASFYNSSGALVSSIAASSGSAVGDIVELNVASRFLRVYYTATSGTGTATIIASRKGG